MTLRRIFTLLACAALPALSQENKTLPFVTKGAQPRAELVTVVRNITNANPLADENGVVVRGTAEQVALAEWLMQSLDRAPDAPAPQPQNLASGEFHLEGGESVRIAYLPVSSTAQNLAEVSTIIRSIGDIPRVFTYNALSAIILRTTAENVALSDWLVTQMTNRSGVSQPEFRVKGTGEHVVRLMDAGFTRTPQELAEAATMVRGISEAKRVFTNNTGRIVAVRGTEDQVALADWLFRQLASKSATRAVTYTGPVPAAAEDRLTLFFPLAKDAEALSKAATLIRTEAQLKRVFVYNTARAVAARGTSAQLATAERLLREGGY